MVHRRRELKSSHHEGTVTHGCNDRALRLSDRGSDRGGCRVSHATVIARRHDAPRVVQAEMLGAHDSAVPRIADVHGVPWKDALYQNTRVGGEVKVIGDRR